MRGDLVSRPIGEVMREARALVKSGVKELLVISQDTSAYGVDLKYRTDFVDGRPVRTRMTELCRELGLGPRARRVGAAALRVSVPARRRGDPADGRGRCCPTSTCRSSTRIPRCSQADEAAGERRAQPRADPGWRRLVPGLTIRSTFIAGFPGETEARVRGPARLPEGGGARPRRLLRVLAGRGRGGQRAARRAARRGARGASQALHAGRRQRISRRRLKRRIGTVQRVLVDAAGPEGAIARSAADAPEIDGVVHVTDGGGLRAGDFARVTVTGAAAHDLTARLAG
jgi:ribosomal protein S12 methylthiotransferase